MSLQDDVNKALGLLQVLEDKDGSLSAVKKIEQPPLARTIKHCKVGILSALLQHVRSVSHLAGTRNRRRPARPARVRGPGSPKRVW